MGKWIGDEQQDAALSNVNKIAMDTGGDDDDDDETMIRNDLIRMPASNCHSTNTTTNRSKHRADLGSSCRFWTVNRSTMRTMFSNRWMSGRNRWWKQTKRTMYRTSLNRFWTHFESTSTISKARRPEERDLKINWFARLAIDCWTTISCLTGKERNRNRNENSITIWLTLLVWTKKKVNCSSKLVRIKFDRERNLQSKHGCLMFSYHFFSSRVRPMSPNQNWFVHDLKLIAFDDQRSATFALVVFN